MQARGGELPWKSLDKHLLAPLNAHLALMFTEVQQPTILQEWAQYVWTVQEYEDWSVVFEEAAASSCPFSHADITWRALCSLKTAQFMGGIPDCQAPIKTSAGSPQISHLLCQGSCLGLSVIASCVCVSAYSFRQIHYSAPSCLLGGTSLAC